MLENSNPKILSIICHEDHNPHRLVVDCCWCGPSTRHSPPTAPWGFSSFFSGMAGGGGLMYGSKESFAAPKPAKIRESDSYRLPCVLNGHTHRDTLKRYMYTDVPLFFGLLFLQNLLHRFDLSNIFHLCFPRAHTAFLGESSRRFGKVDSEKECDHGHSIVQ